MKSAKLRKLKTIIKNLERIVIACSGGVDSTFLAKVATDTLGRENALCVTARSETYPKREFIESKNFAKILGLRQRIIETSELAIKNFADNPPDRCYYCKDELFRKLKDIAREERLNAVIDGANYDDIYDYRPGRDAARNLGVLSPLIEAGLGKADIRAFSKKLGIPTWDKPSFACLSSRFPYYEKITKDKLRNVEGR